MANFDTFQGTGIGRYSGDPGSGATIAWTFKDAGEPGRDDTVDILIMDADAVVVLNVSGNIRQGNLQALPPGNNSSPLDASTLGETLWVLTGDEYTAVVAWLDSTDPATEMCYTE